MKSHFKSILIIAIRWALEVWYSYNTESSHYLNVNYNYTIVSEWQLSGYLDVYNTSNLSRILISYVLLNELVNGTLNKYAGIYIS